MDAYKIKATVNHAIDTTDTIIAYWTRNDRVTTLPLFINGNKLYPHEECFIDTATFSNTQADLTGYVYRVKTLGGAHIGWIPRDTNLNAAILEYSLLIHPKSIYDTADSVTSIPELSLQDGINIYPNPTEGTHTISIQKASASEVNLALYNLSGQCIHIQSLGVLSQGSYSFEADVSSLPQGLYIYDVQMDDKHHRKIISKL
jgi:hypothetical protein